MVSRSETNDTFPLIEISGPAYERGKQYGFLAGEQIARGLDIYRESFKNSGLEWNAMLEVARQFSTDVVGYDAEMAEELRGIAKGAECSFEEVIVLNARTELLFWNNRTAVPENAEACTAAAVLAEGTRDGKILHGQNWDWNPKCAESAVVLKVISENGPDILTFVEAGQLARNGLNSNGLALTANGLHSNTDYGRVGVPNPFIRRKMLQCERLAPALFIAMNAQRSFSHCLMLSHADGEVVCLETTPDSVFWLLPESDVIAHANHFKSPAALSHIKDVGVLRTPESLYRDRRVEATIRRDSGQVTVETFMNAFKDSYGSPDAVLRSPGLRPGNNLSATVATVIMRPADKIMWIAKSPYQGVHFREYKLGD